MSDDYISTFVAEFQHKQNEYADIEREIGDIFKNSLEKEKAIFHWESRVKNTESLRTKLYKREEENTYPSQRENCASLKDLVAGRIVLPRWAHFNTVKEIMRSNFEIQSETQHPKMPKEPKLLQERFRGYDGSHFHIKHKDLCIAGVPLLVEIQVMSPFMWTFQEFQHDIQHKQLETSSAEKDRALQYLCGIANMGEVAVKHFEDSAAQPLQTGVNFQPEIASRSFSGTMGNDYLKSLKSLALEQTQTLRFVEDMVKELLDEDGKISKWISDIDVQLDHNKARHKLGKRYHTSGQWFRNHYDTWVTSHSPPTLWLAGSVGMGKTSLICNIIEWHFDYIQGTADKLAFFYCSKGQANQGTSPLEVMRSLVLQLSRSGGTILPNTKKYYKDERSRPFDIEDCCYILTEIVEQSPRTTIIIDALDECENPISLLQNLEAIWNVVGSTKRSIKFLISARLQIIPPDSFPSLKKIELNDKDCQTGDDMGNYIKTEVKKRSELRLGAALLDGRSPDLEDRLITALEKRASGMFRWVELQLEVFFGSKSRLKTRKDVIQKLDQLESDTSMGSAKLYQVYDEVYEDNTIEGNDSRYIADRLMKWLLYAFHPLHIQHLVEIASFSVGNFHIEDDPDNISFSEILDILSNFVVLDVSNIVRLSHVSVREYFMQKKLGHIDAFSLDSSHAEIARTSLYYITRLPLEDMVSQVQNIKISYSEIGDHFEKALIRVSGYSYLYWADHWKEISPSGRKCYLETLCYDLMNEEWGKPRFIEWLETLHGLQLRRARVPYVLKPDPYSLRHRLECCNTAPVNPLFAACVWDLCEFIPRSFWIPHNLNSENHFFKAPIHLAAKYGNKNTLLSLLNNGADVNLRCSVGGNTPLHEAVSSLPGLKNIPFLVERMHPSTIIDCNWEKSTVLNEFIIHLQDVPMNLVEGSINIEALLCLLLEKFEPSQLLKQAQGRSILDHATQLDNQLALKTLLAFLDRGHGHDMEKILTSLFETTHPRYIRPKTFQFLVCFIELKGLSLDSQAYREELARLNNMVAG